MINNIFIFVLILYIVITNPYIKFVTNETGVYMIYTKKQYIVDENGYKELDHVKIKKLL